MIFGYPVSEQQLVILNYLGMRGEISLWLLRFVSVLCLIWVLKIWFVILKKIINVNIAKISAIIILITPLFFVLAMVYPLLCVKLLLFVAGIKLCLSQRKYFVFLAIILVLFDLFVLNNKPAIFSKINLKDAQSEVTKRISGEDSLQESIKMPLWWRRVSYNKIFFSYKQITAEMLPFFDFESVFFQEINPLAQKSIVIFYWPEVFLFILGIYFLMNFKNQKLNSFLLIIIGLSWLDFIFSEGAPFFRLLLVVLPISIIISLGLTNLPKFLRLMTYFLIVFGVINSFYDLNVRNDYWLDNRPLAFDFWFKEIKKLDVDQYNSIQISSLVGDSKKYCYFYLGKACDDKKFVFNSFDLSKQKQSNTIYAGFAGEFVGSKFKNDIDSNWDNMSVVKIVAKKSLRDTIANQYGNDIGVGVFQ